MEDCGEEKVPVGFDRGVDFEDIKNRLLEKLTKLHDKLFVDGETKILTLRKITYIVIALLQLRNGSRISEAVKAFIKFINDGINRRVTVKISKTDAIKVTKNGEKKRSKARFREMMWPKWIPSEIFDLLSDNKEVDKLIKSNRLKKRVLDYLLINFKCNTHSLRYAFINYMIYVKKRPINDVAKFVGHANVSQMVAYTQIKNSNQIFELDI